MADAHAHSEGAQATTVKDPVCGMTVEPSAGKPTAEHEGEQYYFCSERCRKRFEEDAKYWLSGDREPEPMPEGTRYTCPMHPEIVRDEYGDCPKCGMALEPMTPSADAGPSPELVDFRRRLWIGAPLALAVFVLEMGIHVGIPFGEWLGPRLHVWLQLLLATPVVLWVGLPFFKRGWASIVSLSPNMWTLISLGTGAAYLFSLLGILAPGVLPGSLLDQHGLAPIYFEAAAVI
ncbi:MAG TPA: heavy metal-binding domain-containing protein, partial [Alphaproteobacteria bacterium]|nr:heavy metal-binding domain-containing protein [Alphaproteobacteria bacterium]